MVEGFLAILGVFTAPISSGDTPFRSARLTIADAFKLNQNTIIKLLSITLPLFAIGFLFTKLNFEIIWRYFGWANQTIATLVLWISAMYMVTQKKSAWFIIIPATFITTVITSYILISPEDFSMSYVIAYPISIITAISALILFMFAAKKNQYRN